MPRQRAQAIPIGRSGRRLSSRLVTLAGCTARVHAALLPPPAGPAFANSPGRRTDCPAPVPRVHAERRQLQTGIPGGLRAPRPGRLGYAHLAAGRLASSRWPVRLRGSEEPSPVSRSAYIGASHQIRASHSCTGVWPARGVYFLAMCPLLFFWYCVSRHAQAAMPDTRSGRAGSAVRRRSS